MAKKGASQKRCFAESRKKMRNDTPLPIFFSIRCKQDRCRAPHHFYSREWCGLLRLEAARWILSTRLSLRTAVGSYSTLLRTSRRRFRRIFTWINNQPLSGRMYAGGGEADGQIPVGVTALECQARKIAQRGCATPCQFTFSHEMKCWVLSFGVTQAVCGGVGI